MKRTFLAFISVLALAAAGSAFAQTDTKPYDSTDPAATTADTTSQPGTMDSTSGSTTTPTEESMPATASSLPLVLTLGVSALGGAVALRLYRLRRAH